MNDAVTEHDLDRARSTISERLGLYFPEARSKELLAALERAARELEKPPALGVSWVFGKRLSTAEFDVLARHLTIGETYFFRETAAFAGLESHVFPSLLRKRRASRALRIWSAGCCTGEEPYSLAILLERLLPDWLSWSTLILGTDINTEFLARAKRGIYGQWSFRDVSPDLRKAYFVERDARRYELLKRVRERVQFSRLNLADASFPNRTTQMHDFDLILCRNVLMYFSPERAREVVGRLRASLANGGFLVVSSTEVSQTLFKDFRPLRLDDAVFFERSDAPTAVNAPPSNASCAALDDPEGGARVASLAPARGASGPKPRASRERAPIAKQDQASVSLLSPATLVQRARVAADQGRLEKALGLVRDALARNKLDPAAYHLKASILVELEQLPDAISALEVALYLDPEFVLAHFTLGYLSLQSGSPAEARRHFVNVLSLIGTLPDASLIPESEGLTVGRLKALAQSQLDEVN